MAGYQRQDTNNNIANGNVIDADDFDNEFNAIEDAFNASTGHNHDGTPGGGATLTSIGPSSDFVVTATDVKGKTANTLDIGTSGVPFKDGYFDGTLNTDILSVDETSTFTGEATFNGGLNGTLTGDLVGDVYSTDGTSKVLESGTDGTNATFTGDVTGNLTGDIKNSDLTTIFDSGSDASLATYYGTLINSNSTVILTPGSDAVTAEFEGNANTADAWSTARVVTFGGTDSNGDAIGDVTGSFTIDGSGNVSDVELTVVSTSVPAGSITLGTDTSGAYVQSVSAGTGVTLTDSSQVSDDFTIQEIAIGQDVGTTSSVTFNEVRATKLIGDLYAEDGNGTYKIIENGTDGTNATFTGTVTGTVSSISNHNTDDLTEAANATNKYFTDARARAAFSAGTGISITNGQISATATAPADATTTTKGIASFSSSNFSVSNGAVSIKSSGIGATELNVTGNGSTSQFLRSDGDGTFTWATPTDTNTTYSTNTTYGTTASGTQIRMHTSYGAGNWSVSNGSFTASGNITAYSDERLKDNIRTVDNALNMVSDMRGVFYDRDGEAGVGVIAQEMQKVLPEVVMDGEYLSVSYGNIVGVLIEAIKELKAEVEELKNGSTN